MVNHREANVVARSKLLAELQLARVLAKKENEKRGKEKREDGGKGGEVSDGCDENEQQLGAVPSAL